MKIKAPLLFCSLCLSFPLAAQEHHTLYFKDGKKALEGRWTYTAGAFQKTNLIEYALYGMARSEDRDEGPESRNDFGFAGGVTMFSMNLRFEGLVKTWYPDGGKRSEINYKKGVATGACTVWYSNGNKAWQGDLSEGMRAGEWIGWYRDGRLFCRGTLEGLGQATQEAFWQQAMGEDRHFGKAVFGGDLLALRSTDTSKATEEVRQVFDHLQEQGLGLQSGSMVFFQKNGDTLASIAVRNGLRDGWWKRWRSKGGGTGVELALEYSRGSLLSITDESGRRGTGDYVAAWKSRREQVREAGRTGEWETAAPVDPGVEIISPAAAPGPALQHTQADNRAPLFPGPGDLGEWIRQHIRYPASALRDSTYGNVTVTLLLNAAGKRTDAFVQNSSGHAGLDSEALRVVKGLPDFQPATSNGKKVRWSMLVGVRFDYPGMNPYGYLAPTSEPGLMQTSVDRPPSFPGLSSWMDQNLRYPDSEKRLGHGGKVLVQFTVNPDGSLSDVKVARSSGYPALDAEAVRMIRAMPHWKPAEKSGRPVRSSFKQPVTFRID